MREIADENNAEAVRQLACIIGKNLISSRQAQDVSVEHPYSNLDFLQF